LEQKLVHIVESSFLNKKALYSALSENFQLSESDCPIKSLDMLTHQKPDLILISLNFKFPLDTYAYIKMVSNISKFSETPLLLIGDNDRFIEIEAGIRQGATDFITVPFNNINLIHRVKSNIILSEYYKNEKLRKPTKSFISFEENFKKNFINFMNSYLYEKPPSLVVCANQMGMSVSSLERYCKLYFGVTPTKYILNLKLEMSLRLLKKSNGNVKYVSNYLGFSSVPHFCLCFKNNYYESPKRYINNKFLKVS